VVKADAYGHGLVECARIFTRAGAHALGVATVEEGVRLRASGLCETVVVLIGLLPDEAEAAVEPRARMRWW